MHAGMHLARTVDARRKRRDARLPYQELPEGVALPRLR
jgi:hypothetical protein